VQELSLNLELTLSLELYIDRFGQLKSYHK